MNGFAALDIPPCRRYVAVKATAGFAVCRLILKLLLFYSCLDFTQNLGETQYYRNLRDPWLFLLLLFALFAIIKHSIVFGIFSLVSAIPSILYQLQIINVRQKAKTWEQ